MLDPDSFTQTSDVYEENLKAGKYMFNVPGWMSTNANTEFNKAEGNEKTFVSMPSLTADAEDRFGNMYRGERQYVVNANTENPERCVALLDFVSTYEFSRIAWNGLARSRPPPCCGSGCGSGRGESGSPWRRWDG